MVCFGIVKFFKTNINSVIIIDHYRRDTIVETLSNSFLWAVYKYVGRNPICTTLVDIIAIIAVPPPVHSLDPVTPLPRSARFYCSN